MFDSLKDEADTNPECVSLFILSGLPPLSVALTSKPIDSTEDVNDRKQFTNTLLHFFKRHNNYLKLTWDTTL